MIITDKGQRNLTNIDPSSDLNDNTSFYIAGDDNYIEIGKNCIIDGVGFSFFGHGHHVKIGDSVCLYKGLIAFENADTYLEIGNNSVFHQGFQFGICESNRKLIIGSGCLGSAWVRMRTTDSHSILAMDTNLRINKGKDIIVGDKVWFCEGVHILKGANIGHDSVIGAGSVVTGKEFPPHCVIAGNPAKVVRSGIRWQEKREDIR